MRYLTCCVNSTADLINALTESGREITRRTFQKSADPDSLREWERAAGYDTGTERGGLRMSKDWAVAYYKGVYDGRPCVYLVHSAIEYIFV